jgi:hypothetical protein
MSRLYLRSVQISKTSCQVARSFHNSNNTNQIAKEIYVITDLAEPLMLASLREAGRSKAESNEYAKKLFSSFRSVFDAKRLCERAIFYVEQLGRKYIVRHVLNLEKRQRKSDDKVVGMTVADLAAAKMLIGNFAAGCALSTVRWEIYDGFDLTNRLEIGRFDNHDLISESVPEQAPRPLGDWDFDKIMLMHCCPLCRKCFDSSSLLYTSEVPCESCDQKVPTERSGDIIRSLVHSYQDRRKKIKTYMGSDSQERSAVQLYVDPVPNSVMYWFLERSQCSISDWRSLLPGGLGNDLDQMYYCSIFNMMRMSYARNEFRLYLQQLPDSVSRDIEYDLGVLMRIGEMFNLPWHSVRELKKDNEVVDRLELDHAREFLPTLINRIILNHTSTFPLEQE